MKHTLFILDYFYPFIGGIETLFDDVAKFCSEKNMKITVLTSRHHPDLRKIEKRDDITIYRVGRNRFTILFAVLWFALSNNQLIKTVNHIHTSTFTSSIPAWIIGKLWNIPVTITIHEIYNTLRYHLKGWKGRFYIRFEHLVCHLPRHTIVTVSQASKTSLQTTYPKLNNDTIVVILNQIDTTFWNRESVLQENQNTIKKTHTIVESDKLFLFIGRLWYEKGLPYLIEAFSEIKNTDYQAKLIIIAPRTKQFYKKWIQNQIDSTLRQIKDNYLTNNIIRIDPVQDNIILKTWMSVCHIGIVPSMSEGFCYTAVQMQAMGLQIIASEVGALPEVLDQSTTLFVPYGKVQSLYEAFAQALDSKMKPSSIQQQQKIIDYTSYYNLFNK